MALERGCRGRDDTEAAVAISHDTQRLAGTA
jgi:hypothetical protein